MAGIFNLFGHIPAPDKGVAVKSLSKSKTSLGVNGASLKNVGQSKPKGLSIRSHSDLNVPAIVQDSSSKKQECMKPKVTQLDIGGRPISPKKEILSKRSNGSSNKIKNVSPKSTFDKKSIKLPMPSDEVIFKKPFPPKSYVKKKYPEPERLAPYYDMQFEFDDIYTKTIVNEFKELLTKKRNEMEVYEDEGFQSDADRIDIEMPEFRASPRSLDDERAQCKTPELPEISDTEDNP